MNTIQMRALKAGCFVVHEQAGIGDFVKLTEWGGDTLIVSDTPRGAVADHPQNFKVWTGMLFQAQNIVTHEHVRGGDGDWGNEFDTEVDVVDAVVGHILVNGGELSDFVVHCIPLPMSGRFESVNAAELADQIMYPHF